MNKNNAMKQKMKNSQAAGPDEIPVEAWKSLGDMGAEKLTELIHKIWKEERMPAEWRERE